MIDRSRRRRQLGRLAGLTAVLALLFPLACNAAFKREGPPVAGQVTIPEQSDWVDCGPILHAGAEGEWDYYLWGGFASAVVKKDGIYYLYYQGSEGYDDAAGTVTFRAIGVATSSDGVHFVRYDQNPVLTWLPNNHFEEGAVSAGAFLDTTGEIAIYYGANRWAGADRVNADGRLAVSADGFHFVDQGVVLDHSDGALWGSGDELFPVIGWQANGRWLTYYIPNGTLQRRQLGVAWGDSRTNLSHTAAARSGGKITAWGPAGHARIGPGLFALFTSNGYGPNGPVVEVRTVSVSDPANLSAPVVTYLFPDVWVATVFLDEMTDRWLMYYRHVDHEWYGVKLASASGGNAACPAAAQQLYLPHVGLDD